MALSTPSTLEFATHPLRNFWIRRYKHLPHVTCRSELASFTGCRILCLTQSGISMERPSLGFNFIFFDLIFCFSARRRGKKAITRGNRGAKKGGKRSTKLKIKGHWIRKCLKYVVQVLPEYQIRLSLFSESLRLNAIKFSLKQKLPYQWLQGLWHTNCFVSIRSTNVALLWRWPVLCRNPPTLLPLYLQCTMLHPSKSLLSRREVSDCRFSVGKFVTMYQSNNRPSGYC